MREKREDMRGNEAVRGREGEEELEEIGKGCQMKLGKRQTDETKDRNAAPRKKQKRKKGRKKQIPCRVACRGICRSSVCRLCSLLSRANGKPRLLLSPPLNAQTAFQRPRNHTRATRSQPYVYVASTHNGVACGGKHLH